MGKIYGINTIRKIIFKILVKLVFFYVQKYDIVGDYSDVIRVCNKLIDEAQKETQVD